MENEKIKYLIDIINDMDIKDKLRLAICMSQSKWSGLIYNTKENYKKFDSMLKNIDEEYMKKNQQLIYCIKNKELQNQKK